LGCDCKASSSACTATGGFGNLDGIISRRSKTISELRDIQGLCCLLYEINVLSVYTGMMVKVLTVPSLPNRDQVKVRAVEGASTGDGVKGNGIRRRR
jgi:hypothetical protein